MNSLVLMSDPRVAAIPVRECGEPLVDVRDHNFRVDPRKLDPLGAFAHVREGVLARLEHAALAPARRHRPAVHRGLPAAFPPAALLHRVLGRVGRRPARTGQLSNCTRPPAGTCRRRRSHPTPQARPWTSPSSTRTATNSTSAPASTPPPRRATGPASLTPRTSANTRVTTARCCSTPWRAAGFTNYGTEFWHFSVADRYDALMRQEPHARYGPIELHLTRRHPRPLPRHPRRSGTTGARSPNPDPVAPHGSQSEHIGRRHVCPTTPSRRSRPSRARLPETNHRTPLAPARPVLPPSGSRAQDDRSEGGHPAGRAVAPVTRSSSTTGTPGGNSTSS